MEELWLDESSLVELRPQLVKKLTPLSRFLFDLQTVAPANDLKTIREANQTTGEETAVGTLLSLLPQWGDEGARWLVGVLETLGMHEAIRKLEIERRIEVRRTLSDSYSSSSSSMSRNSSFSSVVGGRDSRKQQRSVSDSMSMAMDARRDASAVPHSCSEPASLSRPVLRRQSSKSLGVHAGTGTEAIPHELLLPLITMLNSPADSDWRDLAKRFGIQEKDIDKMDNEGGRASALMQKLINCGITMQEVAVQAMDMKRHDVVSLLENAGYQTSVVGNGHSQVISPSAFQKHSASLSRTVIPEFSTLSSPSLTRSPGMLRRIGTCTSENTRSPTFRSLLTNTRHQQRDGIDPLCGNQLQLSIPSYLSRKRTPEQYPISSNSSRSYSDGSCDHIQAADVQKVALVIGNSEYLVPNLVQQNFVFEARALAAQLKEMNWTVTLVENATLSQLQRALVAFSDKCQQESPVFALVFYGGHVITTNGTSYLVHVDLSLPLSVAYVSHCLVPLRNLLQLLSNCVVVVAIISCIREQTSVACSGMSFSGGDITIPKLSSQTCVIIAANSQQPVSVATSFAMQLTLCVKKSYDVSLCSIVEHIGWSGDTTVASRCHCYCRSLMNLNFYSISQTVETCVSKTDMLRRVLVFGRESDESDLHRLMEVFDKEDWRAEYCTNTANPITTLQTFLFNTGVTQTAQTAALVILMGNLSTIDQEPTLFFHPLSPSPTTGSTLSVEPSSDALPLSMVADMMAEAIIGPKLLVVNNCDLSMDVDEKYCSRMVMPRVNMLVSISRYRIQQYVSRFIPSWKDSKFESLLNVFREIAPNTTKSCLFTI